MTLQGWIYLIGGVITMLVAGTLTELENREERRSGGHDPDDPPLLTGPPLLIGLCVGFLWPLGLLVVAGFILYAPIWLCATAIDRHAIRAERRRLDADRVSRLERELLEVDA